MIEVQGITKALRGENRCVGEMLEEAFMKLTASSVEYHAGVPEAATTGESGQC